MEELSTMTPQIEYDQLGTRYKRVSNKPPAHLNWLFLPGGAGVDSCYFETLLSHIHLPGSIWLIDFPGNGSNIDASNGEYDFE